MNPVLSPDDKRRIRDAMRVPFFAFAALLVLLAAIVLLGTLMPGRTASFLEAGLTMCMIGTVLLFSMEVLHEPPALRMFSAVGFFWVAILFSITLIDYMTR